MCPQKDLFQNVHSSFFHNRQKLETIQTSIHRRTDEQSMVWPYNEILLSNKKGAKSSTPNNMNKPQKHCVEYKTLVVKEQML